MKKLSIILLALVTIAGASYALYKYIYEVPIFYVVIPTYNNEEWCIKNITTLVEQSYPHWCALIINDNSSDETSIRLRTFIQSHHLENKITLIDNKKRCGACQNIYEAICGADNEIHTIAPCPNDRYIIAIYDGDDWLAHKDALKRIAREYEDPRTWMTYGNYECYPRGIASCCAPIPQRVFEKNSFREHYPWVMSHLRTVKCWLFKKIKREDLLFREAFFPTSYDLAFFFPVAEMASRGNHIKYITDVIYIYNTATPLNDYKQHAQLQQFFGEWIRHMPKYQPLETES